MYSRQEFNELVSDAYNHLYDLVYLRTHPLARLGAPETDHTSKESAWQLHNLLVQTIQELNPGPQTPVKSNEWRRFRIMELRFLDGLEPQVVAEQLFISRRHFYREMAESLKACADLLWGLYAPGPMAAHEPPPEFAPALPTNQQRLELLRIEAAQFHHVNSCTNVNEIIRDVLNLVEEPASKQGISIETDLAKNLLVSTIDPSILRQILFGLMNLLFPYAAPPQIYIATRNQNNEILVSCSAPITEAVETEGIRDEEKLSTITELAEINSAHLYFDTYSPQLANVCLVLPIAQQRTVLVADDNADLRQLLSSYMCRSYRVMEARTGMETIQMAREIRPFAILLDLMMPDRDGWEVLQSLKNDPHTQAIPVVICSVLGMKDLALSMGALSFLAKPVSEKDLLSVLKSINGSSIIN